MIFALVFRFLRWSSQLPDTRKKENSNVLMLTWELVNKSRSLSLRSIGASTASLMLCAELLLMSMMMISFCEIPSDLTIRNKNKRTLIVRRAGLSMSMMMIIFCEIPTCPQGQWPTWREALQLTKVGSQDEPFHTILSRHKFWKGSFKSKTFQCFLRWS